MEEEIKKFGRGVMEWSTHCLLEGKLRMTTDLACGCSS
jgi:hypothetical protein